MKERPLSDPAPRARRPFLLAVSVALATAGLALSPSIATAQTSAPANAEAEVRKVLETYITASRDTDAAAARAIFHPNAIMTGSSAGGKMNFGTPESFFNSLARMSAEPTKKPYGAAKVVDVRIAGDIATGTVEESNFNGKRYTDMFQLVRHEGHWLIISKTYFGTPL